MKPPAVGQIMDGYVFLGGDPANEKNWQEILPEDISDPTEGMDTGEKLLAGIGSGMVDVARKAGQLALPKKYEKGFFSQDAIDEQTRLDAPLLETGAGLAGNVIGGAAATAPAGMGVAGALGKGAGALSQATGRLRTLGRVAGSRPVSSAAQGAAEGALLAGQEDLGRGAGTGAAIGGMMTAGSRGLSKARGLAKRAFGAKMSPEAQYLERATDTFIPIAQGAERGLPKTWYESVLSNLPGTAGMLRRQAENAFKDFEETVLQKAMPENAPFDLLKGAKDPNEMFQRLDAIWKTSFDQIKDLDTILTRHTWTPPARGIGVLQDFYKRKGAQVRIPQVGDQLKTGELLSIRRDVGEALTMLSGSANRNERAALKGVEEAIDKHLNKSMDPTGKGRGLRAKLLREYKANLENWKKWSIVKDTMKNAIDLAPKRLIRAATKRERGAEFQELGMAADKALKKASSEGNIYQLIAAYSVGLGMPAGLALLSDEPWVAPGLYGGYLAMATPKGQRLVRSLANKTARTPAQQSVRRMTGFGTRQLGISGYEEGQE